MYQLMYFMDPPPRPFHLGHPCIHGRVSIWCAPFRFKAFAAQPRLAIVTKTLALAANDLTHFGIVTQLELFECANPQMMCFGVEEHGGLNVQNHICEKTAAVSACDAGVLVHFLHLCCHGNGLLWKRSGVFCILRPCLPRTSGSFASRLHVADIW